VQRREHDTRPERFVVLAQATAFTLEASFAARRRERRLRRTLCALLCGIDDIQRLTDDLVLAKAVNDLPARISEADKAVFGKTDYGGPLQLYARCAILLANACDMKRRFHDSADAALQESSNNSRLPAKHRQPVAAARNGDCCLLAHAPQTSHLVETCTQANHLEAGWRVFRPCYGALRRRFSWASLCAAGRRAMQRPPLAMMRSVRQACRPRTSSR
jgi:hypothetical protein